MVRKKNEAKAIKLNVGLSKNRTDNKIKQKICEAQREKTRVSQIQKGIYRECNKSRNNIYLFQLFCFIHMKISQQNQKGSLKCHKIIT